jgi:hypothetical protein
VGAGAVRWSCARCNVSVGRLDGSPTGLPETWTRAGATTFCLTCSRALAGEAALDSAPDACSREDRVRLRREAMIRFEIDRAPLAPNRTIAHACRTSPKTVATIREALDDVSSQHAPTASGGAQG